MNKILVSDIIDLNTGSYILECTNNELDVNINGEVTIYLINEKLNEINIKLEDKSILNVYKYNKYCENSLVVNIDQLNNSKINYNEAFINNLDNELIINNNIIGNDNESVINVRNIYNDETSKIIINVNVLKNTINNIALEDLKGINNGGFIHIEPNIICESNEVSANHLTTIGSLDKRVLEYLMSKGIKESDAKSLLLKGFIFSNMDDDIKDVCGGE